MTRLNTQSKTGKPWYKISVLKGIMRKNKNNKLEMGKQSLGRKVLSKGAKLSIIEGDEN